MSYAAWWLTGLFVRMPETATTQGEIWAQHAAVQRFFWTYWLVWAVLCVALIDLAPLLWRHWRRRHHPQPQP